MPMVWLVLDLLHINHRAIGDAAYLRQPSAAFPLQISGSFGFAAQKEIGDEQYCGRNYD